MNSKKVIGTQGANYRLGTFLHIPIPLGARDRKDTIFEPQKYNQESSTVVAVAVLVSNNGCVQKIQRPETPMVIKRR